MGCERTSDERLQADKMDALYGEADTEVRGRIERHLAECTACREELAALAHVRKDLQAWRLPRWTPRASPRGVVLPRWLAAAAALVLGIGLGVTASGYLTLRGALSEQAARAQALEEQQRQTALALREALAHGGMPRLAERSLLTRLDARLDAKLRQSERRQARQLELRLSDFSARSDAQRRVDLARVAEGLSYLDGRHGQQLARTNELMSYVLDSSAGKR